MTDTHGVYKPGRGLDPATLPAWERELLDSQPLEDPLAPGATSFTVTREWLEKIRTDAEDGKCLDVVTAVDAVLPSPKPLQEIIQDSLLTTRSQDSRSAATVLLHDLNEAGWKVVRDGV